MKYETYAKLTPQQKEEWNFKFKDLTYPQVGLTSAYTLVSLVTVFAAIQLMILKEYIQVATSVNQLTVYALQCVFIIIVIWGVDYLGQLLYYIFKKYQEHAFLKKCKVI